MNERLYKSILKATGKGEVEAYEDLFSFIRETGDHELNKDLRARVGKELKKNVEKKDFHKCELFNDLMFRSLLMSAPTRFEEYLMAVEFKRPPEKKFYLPRRRYLKRYVDAYQAILDGELDFLSISMPKRCGKSQLGINFTNMISGMHPERSTLMEGTGDDLVRSFYDGCLEYLDPKNLEYSFYDIFPGSPFVGSNADTKSFNLQGKSRFPTVMCRSIDARQVGLSEATNMLYLDDCVEGYEESLNRARLDQKWKVISGDIIGRAIEGTPIVICGTRYSIYDPIGRLQEEMLKQGKRCKILEIPALDPITDESNFEYIREGKKVFTTAYFRNQRDMLTKEQFESEFQQQPFESKGILFAEDQLNTFFELPVDIDPDAVVAVCDTADTGSDSCSMPIAVIYGNEAYIVDVVFDNAPPKTTIPECAKALMKNHVEWCTFESNNAGSYFAKDVNEIISQNKGKCSIKTKRTISNKQTRIEFASDNILKHFYFKHKSTYARGSQYDLFMREVVTYTRSGKVPHDDAPDSLSLLENELRKTIGSKAEVFDRPF